MTRPVSTVAATLLLASAAGCSLMPDTIVPDWMTPKEDRVTVSEVRRSQQCNSPGTEAGVFLFNGLEGVRSWEASRGVQLVGDEPLATTQYVLVEMGTRNSGGYGIAISRVAAREGDWLLLKATFVSPTAEQMTTQAITSPCVLVSLPRANFVGVEVIDQYGKRRARSGAAS